MDVTGLLRGYVKRPEGYPRPVFVLVGQVVVWVDGVALVSDADAEVQVDPLLERWPSLEDGQSLGFRL